MKTFIIILLSLQTILSEAFPQGSSAQSQQPVLASIAFTPAEFNRSVSNANIGNQSGEIQPTRPVRINSILTTSCMVINASGLFENTNKFANPAESPENSGCNCTCDLYDFLVVSDFSSYRSGSVFIQRNSTMVINLSDSYKKWLKVRQMPPLMLINNKFASVKRAMNLPRTALIYISPNTYKTRYNIMAPGLKIRMNL